MSDSVTIKGTVVVSRMGEPVPFARVVVADGKGTVVGSSTDFEGNYEVKVAKGKYTITFACVGYAKYVVSEAKYDDDCTLPPIELVLTAKLLGMVEIDEDPHTVIEIDPYGPSQQLEKDGVKVIVR